MVDPPSVQIVLELLASREGALEGNEIDQDAFIDALKRWLPEKLFTRVSTLPMFFLANQCIAWAIEGQLAEQSEDGEEEQEKTPPSMEEVLAELSALDYGRMVSDYARAFSIAPHKVLTETPFTLLMVFQTHSIRVNYRAVYELIMAIGLAQGEDNAERRDSLETIRRLAGIKSKEEAFMDLDPAEQERRAREASRLFAARFGFTYEEPEQPGAEA